MALPNLATKAVYNAKATDTEIKIPDTTYFITILEFNVSTIISFDATVKEATKKRAS